MTDAAFGLAEETEDTMKGRFLTFHLGEEVYGIAIHHVTEIIGLQKINRLPEMPEYMKGIINLRGKIVPVIDMRLKFRKEEMDYTDRTCIVVIETKQLTAGLIVDHVEEVMQVDDIAPSFELEFGVGCRYLNGVGKVGKEVILLLDCDKLFYEEEVNIIQTSIEM